MSALKDRLERNRKNASKGGTRTAELHGQVTDENGQTFVERRATAGGNTCLMRYGRDFYRSIRAMRQS